MNERWLARAPLAAWRSMLRPLDPWHLSPLAPPADRPGAAAWGDTWLDVTRWWTNTLAENRWAWTDANGRLLADIAEGLARRFRGRHIHFAFGDRHVRAVLEAIELEPRHDRYGARLQLADVECDGLRLESLSIVVEAVALTPPPDVTLTVLGVELEGRASLGHLVAWLDGKVPEWQLRVTEDGLIEAVPQSGGKRFVVEPVVFAGELELELRAIRWRRVRVRLPTWLRWTRKVSLPALPAGMSVCEARPQGTSVEFRLSVPAVSRVSIPAGVHPMC